VTGYRLPTDTTYVSDDWAGHRNRNPPSSEPGTDYASPYGAHLYAVADGVVEATKTSNGAATGRYIQVGLDDGRTTRSLHLAEVWVTPWQRVTRGQVIGLTGASAQGSDWGVGAHVHQTLWPGAAWAADTIDFQRYVGEDEPPPPPPPDDDEEDEMGMKGAAYVRGSDGVTMYILFNEASGQWVEHEGGGGDYNNPIAQNWETGSWPTLTESHARVLKTSLTAVQPKAGPVADDPDPTATTTLTGPAWFIGAILGLIGLVEVIRLVVDLII